MLAAIVALMSLLLLPLVQAHWHHPVGARVPADHAGLTHAAHPPAHGASAETGEKGHRPEDTAAGPHCPLCTLKKAFIGAEPSRLPVPFPLILALSRPAPAYAPMWAGPSHAPHQPRAPPHLS